MPPLPPLESTPDSSVFQVTQRPDQGTAAMVRAANPEPYGAKHLARDLVQGLWRRRVLILVPILVMVPLSLLGATMLTRVFAARSLLQLQESGRDNPLLRDNSSSSVYRLQERALVEGLRALLTSDRVLQQLLRDWREDEGLTPRQREQRIQELRKAFTLEVIGGEFVELQLKGEQPVGLGKKLETATARFIEALAPELAAATGRQLILNTRRQHLESLLRAKEDLERQLAEARAGRDGRPEAPAGGDISVAPNVALVPAPAAPQEPGPATRASDEGNPGATVPAPRDQAVQQSGERLAALQATIDAARASYEDAVRRYSTTSAASAVGLLRAPELIRVIDPPSDPVAATGRRLPFILSGLAASVLCGLGLAFVAERIDPRLRNPEDIAEASHAPVLATIPAVGWTTVPPAPLARVSRLRAYLASIALALLAVAMYPTRGL